MVNRILAAHKVLGIFFLALLLLGVYLTYAVFTKQFVDYDEVKLKTSTIGLQLPARADVKIRGVIVGEVLDAESEGSSAVLTLGLYPDQIDTIPEDVTGSIVPKTLFGEKYVALVPTDSGDVSPIKAGDTIERTQVSTEVEAVLSDLEPLLETVQPAQLNMTLNAIATALEGRGEELGENLETIDAYLKKLNPKIPELIVDLRKTAEVADTYSDVLPQVADILDDTVITTGTLEDREEKLRGLLTDVSSFADTTRTFLDVNEDSIVRLGEVSAPQLRILSRYSTEFPCLSGGLVKASSLFAEAFRDYTLHIVLETLPRQPRAYNPGDKPVYGEDRGPNCLSLPNSPAGRDNFARRVPDFDDGVTVPTGKGNRVAPDYRFGDLGNTGTPAETDLMRSLLAPSYGVADSDLDSIGDIGPLMIAPIVRGAKVDVQ